MGEHGLSEGLGFVLMTQLNKGLSLPQEVGRVSLPSFPKGLGVVWLPVAPLTIPVPTDPGPPGLHTSTYRPTQAHHHLSDLW